MAVDREFACILFMCIYFVICWFPLGVFGAHFAFLGVTLGFLLGAFGAPWASKGLSLASLWLPFGSLGTPWDHLGTLGSQVELGLTLRQKWTSFSEQGGLE